MRKIKLLAAVLFLAAIASAANAQNNVLYIEGTATTVEHWSFFLENFRMEAPVLGFEVTENKEEAGFTFRFEVEPYAEEEDPSLQNAISISLIRNEDDEEILSSGWFFGNVEDMYEHNQQFLRQAVMFIPRDPPEPEIIVETVVDIFYETIIETQIEEKIITVQESDDWRNKWLYARASFNYPITFYKLQEDGLIGGVGVYEGPYDKPNRVSPLDNSIIAMPGATLGAEVQFLDWMSAELNFQLSFGRPGFHRYANFALGTEIKFPLKFFRSFVIEPYGAINFYLNKSPVYEKFPRIAMGGGVQVGVKGGSRGSIFVDIGYTHHLGDAVMHNTYGQLYPNPPVIHYQRFILGLGIGYKFGFFDREKDN